MLNVDREIHESAIHLAESLLGHLRAGGAAGVAAAYGNAIGECTYALVQSRDCSLGAIQRDYVAAGLERAARYLERGAEAPAHVERLLDLSRRVKGGAP